MITRKDVGSVAEKIRRPASIFSGSLLIDIRTRQAGKLTFIDFHLVVPGAMSVDDAHAICDSIEAKLREAVKDVQITIHVEPENKAKHSGIVVV